MNADERAIRELIRTWLEASKLADTGTVLSLMSDDVVFLTMGREPFGKKEFAEGSKGNVPKLIDSKHEIKELQLLGDWAWMRSHLEIMMRQPDGKTVSRSGPILTVLKRQPAGNWVIACDANLLAPKT